MKFKRIISAFLSAAVLVTFLMCGSVTASAASVKLDAELTLRTANKGAAAISRCALIKK